MTPIRTNAAVLSSPPAAAPTADLLLTVPPPAAAAPTLPAATAPAGDSQAALGTAPPADGNLAAADLDAAATAAFEQFFAPWRQRAQTRRELLRPRRQAPAPAPLPRLPPAPSAACRAPMG